MRVINIATLLSGKIKTLRQLICHLGRAKRSRDRTKEAVVS